MRVCFLALVAIALLAGCNSGEAIDNKKLKAISVTDVVAGMRSAGWEIERAEEDLRRGGIRFGTGDFFVVSVNEAEDKGTGDVRLEESTRVNDIIVVVMAWPIAEEDFDMVCEDQSVNQKWGDLCSAPFEQQVEMAKRIEGEYLDAAEEIILELSQN